MHMQLFDSHFVISVHTVDKTTLFLQVVDKCEHKLYSNLRYQIKRDEMGDTHTTNKKRYVHLDRDPTRKRLQESPKCRLG